MLHANQHYTIAPAINTVEHSGRSTMEPVNFGYSMKNVPVHSNKDYLMRLIMSTEKFVRAIRWRTYFFLNPPTNSKQKDTYGFNSTKTAPNITEINTFEDQLLEMIRNIRFKDNHNPFQRTRIRVQAQKETPPVQCIIVKFYCIYKSHNIILCLINCLCN